VSSGLLVPYTKTILDVAERDFFEQIQELLSAREQSHKKKKRKSKVVKKFRIICGVDAAYSSDDRVVAVASVLDSESGELLEQNEYSGVSNFPYVPGLFFIREGPFVTEALRGLKKKEPDLVCFDAHGLAHPRRLGLATICGMILKIPSIGIAKTKLVGEEEPYKRDLDRLIEEKEKTLGFVSAHPSGKKRYWSPGYSISISELERIIENYGDTCLDSIQRSHLRARRRVSFEKSRP
jgi:deoxyribonuclease V